jgi:hypothetical protein
MILKRCIEAALEGQRQENFECTLADTVGLERLWYIILNSCSVLFFICVLLDSSAVRGSMASGVTIHPMGNMRNGLVRL